MWLVLILSILLTIIGNCSGFFYLEPPSYNFLILDSSSVKNERCREDSLLYRKELEKYTNWAVQMYDSSVKSPEGVMNGGTHFYGNYDQCLNIKVENLDLQGKYCLPTLIFKLPNNESFQENNQPALQPIWNKIFEYSKDARRLPRNKLRWAICVPSSCTQDDLKNHLEGNYENVEVFVDENTCQILNEEGEFNKLENIMWKLTIGLFTAVLLCTIYEMSFVRDEHPKNVFHKILISFSFITNSAKLFTVKPDPHKLEVVHGLRFWGMFFTIMAHQFMYSAPSMNGESIENFYQNKMGAAWLNGPILIDVFFVLTGFIAVYFLLDTIRVKKRFNYALLCLHRILRMIPLYAYIILFYCTLFIRIGSGPIWKEKISEQRNHCLKNWWINLLFINNYIGIDHLCMDQSWYIAANMQLFFLSPLIVIYLHKKTEKTLKILKIILFTIVILNGVQIYYTGLDPVVLVYKILGRVCREKTFQTIYAPTHHRISSYLIGMIGGYYKYKMKQENKRVPRKFVGIGWIFVNLSMLGGMYLGHIFYQNENLNPRPYYKIESALFGTLHHVFIALSIVSFIFLVSDKKGIYIGVFLDKWVVIPLSRLTYSVYLSHLILQMTIQFTTRVANYASVTNFVWHFFGDLTFIYFVGFLLSMFIETPFNNLEDICTGKDIKSYLIERRISRINQTKNDKIK